MTRKLSLQPTTFRKANQMIAELHRHHKPVQGYKFAIACIDSTLQIHGIAVVGRPVSRGCDKVYTAEVTRLVTNGTPHVCSMLYAACARACQAMGYRKIQTYILETEPGTSLKAAGWVFDGMTAGGSWESSKRYREQGRRNDQPQGRKQRWVKELN
jgi:hypothetical protein